jgi:hypothetical protein
MTVTELPLTAMMDLPTLVMVFIGWCRF